MCLPETGRQIVGNGSRPPQRWNYSILALLQRHHSQRSSPDANDDSNNPPRRKPHLPNPIKALKVLKEKDVALVLLFNSLNFAAYYQLTASLPYLLSQIYHFNTLQIGLSFIPFGLGCMIAPTISGLLLDWNYRRVARRHGISLDSKRSHSPENFPLENARIPIAWPMAILAVAAEIIYGWTLEIEAPLPAPLVLTFIMGLSFTATYNSSMVMLVDYYPHEPATATSAVNLCRCWLGAGATAVIIYMVEAMGRGWCFTFIGLVLLAATPALIVLSRCGGRWREERRRRKGEGLGPP